MDENPNCVNCGKPAEVTIDFDVLGDLTQLAVCIACYGIVKADVTRDLKKSGQIDTVNTFSSNGFGRS